MNRSLDDATTPFAERFDLLVQSGQADESSVAATKIVLDAVAKHYGVPMTEELGASLATHLAITLKKLLEGQVLTKAPDELWIDLQDFPEECEFAGKIVTQLEDFLKIKLARDELGFIAIHLCKIKLEVGL